MRAILLCASDPLSSGWRAPAIFPPPKPTRYECTKLPPTCPVCGSPKEAFVLVEED